MNDPPLEHQILALLDALAQARARAELNTMLDRRSGMPNGGPLRSRNQAREQGRMQAYLDAIQLVAVYLNQFIPDSVKGQYLPWPLIQVPNKQLPTPSSPNTRPKNQQKPGQPSTNTARSSTKK